MALNDVSTDEPARTAPYGGETVEHWCLTGVGQLGANEFGVEPSVVHVRRLLPSSARSAHRTFARWARRDTFPLHVMPLMLSCNYFCSIRGRLVKN